MTATIERRKTKTKSKAKPRDEAPLDELEDLASGVELEPLDLTSDTVFDIPLDQIDFHQSNRDLASDASIAELAQSIEQLGQLEAATVRKLPNRRYELISGERRFRALQQLDRKTIRAIIVADTPSHSLVRLAAANSQRRDLNPIERAELIVQLMKPVEDGGSGLSREAAGKAVGLQSESGVKNALRVLRLPESIRAMLKAGELSERAARRLVPFADSPALIKDIATELKDSAVRIELMSEEKDFPWEIRDCLTAHTRPLDSEEFSSSKLVEGKHTRFPKLFSLDQELSANFKRLEFELDGKKRVVTTDTKKWDDLQRPLAAEAWQKQFDRHNRSNSKPKTKVTAKLTPAQIAQEDARKAKEAKERLKRWTEKWKVLALRCEIAHQALAPTRQAVLPVIQSWYRGNVVDILYAAYEECHLPVPRGMSVAELPSTGTTDWTSSFFRLLLWPESTLTKKRDDRNAVVHAGVLPDLDSVSVQICAQRVRDLAVHCNVTIGSFWSSARNEGSQQRLLEAWLSRHTTSQLQSLWRSMKLPPTKLNKRAEMVAAMLERHRTDELPLPKGW